MVGLLQDILCVLQGLAKYFALALVTVVNLLVAGIGAFAGAIVGLLPGMPDAPGPPDSGVIGFLAWLYPLGPLLAGVAIFVGLWVVWMGVATALRWVKVIQ
jgi:TctA family transporter